MLANLAEKYPELPNLLRFKASLLFCGVCYSPCMTRFCEAHPLVAHRPYWIAESERIVPARLCLQNQTLVRLLTTRSSPFVLKAEGDSFTVYESNQPLYYAFLEEETLSPDAQICGDRVNFTLSPTRPFNPVLPPSPPSGVRHCLLRIEEDLDAKTAGALCIEAAQKLNAMGVMERLFVYVEAGPLSLADWQSLKALGVRGARFHFGAWEPAIFARFGVTRAVRGARALWLESMRAAVSVFGRGYVLCVFRAGAALEMSSPSQLCESMYHNSMLASETLIPQGIYPVWSVLWIKTGSGDMTPCNLDLLLRINIYSAQLRKQHQLFCDPNMICPNCCPQCLEADFDEMYREVGTHARAD